MSDGKCSTAGCATTKIVSRGMCESCYRKLYRSGAFQLALPARDVHRLTSVDREAKTAVCTICGPTRIYVRPDRPTAQCWSRRMEGKKRARLLRPSYPRQNRTGSPWSDRIQWKYGLTADRWDQILIDQSGRCDICSEPLLEPNVDHDHDTGKVRGLLCRGCNLGLGFLADDPVRAARAADYLTRHAS